MDRPSEVGMASDSPVSLALADSARVRERLKSARESSKRLYTENLELRQRLGEDCSGSVLSDEDAVDEVASALALSQKLDTPSDDLSWCDLHDIEEALGPVVRALQWNRIASDARNAVESGFQSAEVVQPGASPLEHARYAVIREALIMEWQPSPGSELMLVEMLCQTRYVYEQWLIRHVHQMNYDCLGLTTTDREKQLYGEWFPPRVDAVTALDHSMNSAMRFQNQFIKLVRALRDLRRYSASVTINNPRQVNIGSQQVNMADSV